MNKSMKAIVMCFVAALCLGGLVGCGARAEEVLYEGVTEEFDGIKNHDDDIMGEFAASLKSSGIQLEHYGIDTEEYMRTIFDGFDYRIEEVQVSGDIAHVSIVLTRKSMRDIGQTIETTVQQLAAGESISSMTNDEVTHMVGQVLVKAIKEIEPTETNLIDLEYKRVGSVWEPVRDDMSGFMNEMLR